jgi:hypothetical protein
MLRLPLIQTEIADGRPGVGYEGRLKRGGKWRSRYRRRLAGVQPPACKPSTYNQTELRMPPGGKLPEEKNRAFEKWIAAGAPDPAKTPRRVPTAAPRRKARHGYREPAAKWWAFQPVSPQSQPRVSRTTLREALDARKDRRLRSRPPGAKQAPALAEADRADTHPARRARPYGVASFYEEVQAFVADRDPKAYEKLIDRLLASPRYGERWGRYWLDVVRYGEDNPTSEATNPGYPFAWRYRDWVIESINKDVPYDKFVKLQLAADFMPARRAAICARWATLAPHRFITPICASPKRSRRPFSPTPGTNV